MPRRARLVIPGLPYHVTQRGNNRQTVFYNDWDRKKYLEWVQEYSQKEKAKILAYCLMDSHVHFVVRPERENSLARTFGCVHRTYAQYVNERLGRSGHLWQARFFSCGLSEQHLWRVIRYVECNPVRAGMVKQARDWKWSSARAHLGMAVADVDLEEKSHEKTGGHWQQYLQEGDYDNDRKEIRKLTQQ